MTIKKENYCKSISPDKEITKPAAVFKKPKNRLNSVQKTFLLCHVIFKT